MLWNNFSNLSSNCWHTFHCISLACACFRENQFCLENQKFWYKTGFPKMINTCFGCFFFICFLLTRSGCLPVSNWTRQQVNLEGFSLFYWIHFAKISLINLVFFPFFQSVWKTGNFARWTDHWAIVVPNFVTMNRVGFPGFVETSSLLVFLGTLCVYLAVTPFFDTRLFLTSVS